jgi:hypothetical protein
LNEPPPEPVVADRRRGWNDGDTVRVRRALSERAARALQAVRTPVQRITISDSAGAFVLRGEVGDGVRVTPDGTTARVAWLDGTPADVRTRWVAQRLEVVRRLDGGTMIREFYSRSPGSSRLIVFTIVTGPFDGEITLRRVYEASS